MATDIPFDIAIISMNVLLGTLCLAIARGDRESPALRFWGWGLLVYTLGLVTNIWNLSLQVNAVAVVGYFLIAWAAVLAVKGILSHTRYHLNRQWVGIGLGLVAALLIYNHYGRT